MTVDSLKTFDDIKDKSGVWGTAGAMMQIARVMMHSLSPMMVSDVGLARGRNSSVRSNRRNQFRFELKLSKLASRCPYLTAMGGNPLLTARRALIGRQALAPARVNRSRLEDNQTTSLSSWDDELHAALAPPPTNRALVFDNITLPTSTPYNKHIDGLRIGC